MSYFLDCNKYALIGVIRGLGKLKLSALILILCYYGICLPLAYIFAFKMGMELSGLWIGLIVCQAVLAFFYFYLVHFKFDWVQICNEIRIRNNRPKEKATDLEISCLVENNSNNPSV